MSMNELEKYISVVEKTSYYKKVKSLVKIFEESGMVFRSTGHCMAISDLVQRLLAENRIESELVECTLTVLTRDPFTSAQFLGHDTNDNKLENQVETHIICVTKTEIPILIDLSIGFITKKVNYIVFPIFQELVSNSDNIITLDFGHSTWIYNKRVLSNFPELHEKSIIQRINTDLKIEKKISLINKVIIFVSIISSLNFIRGIYDFHQQYIKPKYKAESISYKIDKTEKNVYK